MSLKLPDKSAHTLRKVRKSCLDVTEVLEEEFRCLQPAPDEANNDPALPAKIESPAKRGRDEKLEELYQEFCHERSPRTALCLSGGGIRSATFGLGLIQGLARCNLLGKFDYLSTVSGGGYIGAWLSAWIKREGLAKVLKELDRIPVPLSPGEQKAPPQPVSPESVVPKIDPEPRAIEHLRSYSNYLAPRVGFFAPDTWSLIAIYLRNLLLNWLVLVPLLAAVLMVPRAALLALSWQSVPWYFVVGALVLAAIGAIKMMAYADFHRPSLVRKRHEREAAKSKTSPQEGKPLASGTREDERHFITGALLWLIGAVVFATAFGMWARHSSKFIDYGMWQHWPLWGWFGGFGAVLTVAGWLVHIRDSGKKGRGRLVTEGLVLLFIGFVGGSVTWLLYHVIANLDRSYLAMLQDGHLRRALYACLAGPGLLALLFVFSSVLIGLVSGFTDDEDREWWARAAAWVFIAMTAWAGFSALVIFGPYLLLFTAARAPAIVASLGGVSGLVAILVGKSGATTAGKGSANAGKKTAKNIAAEISTALAAPIFIIFLLTIVALASTLIVDPDSFQSLQKNYRWHPEAYLQIIERSSWCRLLLFIGGALAISGSMSFSVNINKFSMHAMYRDRLTRAYLGASRERAAGLFSDFQVADNLDMKDLVGPHKKAQRPFHVLSMTLNLTSGSRLSWQNRRAESFTISPLHGGSLRLGYRRVGEYSSIAPTKSAVSRLQTVERSGGLTLGTAMTISGAAVSPNMGYHSSPLVALLLTLFNVRLGWWLGNPGQAGDETFEYASPQIALRPLVSELLGLSDDTSPYVTLSDGGHFENLGLYEMVLRRCRLIVLSDAGEDPAYSFEDLSNALTKIHTDLGVPIVFTDQVPISKYNLKKAQHAHGEDTPAGRYCALGIIRYSAIDKLKNGKAAPDGLLIYIKPTLIGEEPADLLHYARSNPAFPHEPTLDNFYSEAQFESYRILGAHIIDYICVKKGERIPEGVDPLQHFARRAHRHARSPKSRSSATSEIEKVLRGLAKKKGDTAKPVPPVSSSPGVE